ncbi:UL36 very large tegument protein [Streptomyces sp. NPDC093795]|uniref:UL36 very large tegument protein n=1 Tax=Streptomyces sp. NPDC093795 TaxID=3366051 RepID=UPI00380FF0CD
MTVYQLPTEQAVFARWLAELAGRIPPGGGWYGVFAERDPDGLRACFDGTEILPWDVVESLLQDAGEPAEGPLALRGRTLYAAATGAHDRRHGGAEALIERRELMERERRYAEARARELGDRLRATPAPPPEETVRLEHDLAWTRDDHARATSRLTDLTSRLRRLEQHDGTTAGPEPARAPAPAPAWAPPPAPAPDPVPPKAKRRPRGARYAWLEGGDEGQGPVVAPVPASVPSAGGAAPRGARFGVAAAPDREPGAVPDPDAAAEAARAAANAVYALQRLRAQGRSGDAHALLCEALNGPPDRLPALAGELHRAGLGADWSILLWEAASLPPGHLAAVAGALADAGRAADCEQLLRQGVARPVEELAGACDALRAEGHHREAHALLTAFVRVRAPEDAARLASEDPRGLVPLLLDAARAVSAARERDLLHALRVAGLAGG